MRTWAGPHPCAAHDSGRTRACNLWFRRPTPYPLGHRAHAISCRDHCTPLREDSLGATDGPLGQQRPGPVLHSTQYGPPGARTAVRNTGRPGPALQYALRAARGPHCSTQYGPPGARTGVRTPVRGAGRPGPVPSNRTTTLWMKASPHRPTNQPIHATNQPIRPTSQPTHPTNPPITPTDQRSSQPIQPTNQASNTQTHPSDQPTSQPTNPPIRPTGQQSNQPTNPSDQPTHPTNRLTTRARFLYCSLPAMSVAPASATGSSAEALAAASEASTAS